MKTIYDYQWADFNWFGKLMIRLHDILLGPEYDYAPAEENLILNRGLRSSKHA